MSEKRKTGRLNLLIYISEGYHFISKEYQKDNISRILWYSDWLHNTTSAGNSIFVTNHNTTSCGRSSIMQSIRLPTVEYEKWYMEAYTFWSSSSSSSAFNVRGPHITQAWDVRHPCWHGSDGCPQQHSVVSCTNSTTFNGSGYTRLCQGSSMNSWLTWGYWYMFLLLKELLQPDGLPAPTHPLGRGVFNETPSPYDEPLYCSLTSSI